MFSTPDQDLSEISPRKTASPRVKESDSVQYTDGDYDIM